MYPEFGQAKWLLWLPWRRRYSLVNLRPGTQSAEPPEMPIPGNAFDLVEFIAGLRAGLQGVVYTPLVNAAPESWVPYTSDPDWSQEKCPSKLLGQVLNDAVSRTAVLLIRLDNPPNAQQGVLAVFPDRRVCRFFPTGYQPNPADVLYQDGLLYVVTAPLSTSPMEKCPTTGSHKVPREIYEALVAAGLTPTT